MLLHTLLSLVDVGAKKVTLQKILSVIKSREIRVTKKFVWHLLQMTLMGAEKI